MICKKIITLKPHDAKHLSQKDNPVRKIVTHAPTQNNPCNEDERYEVIYNWNNYSWVPHLWVSIFICKAFSEIEKYLGSGMVPDSSSAWVLAESAGGRWCFPWLWYMQVALGCKSTRWAHFLASSDRHSCWGALGGGSLSCSPWRSKWEDLVAFSSGSIMFYEAVIGLWNLCDSPQKIEIKVLIA